jgi:hypothetical protein
MHIVMKDVVPSMLFRQDRTNSQGSSAVSGAGGLTGPSLLLTASALVGDACTRLMASWMYSMPLIIDVRG